MGLDPTFYFFFAGSILWVVMGLSLMVLTRSSPKKIFAVLCLIAGVGAFSTTLEKTDLLADGRWLDMIGMVCGACAYQLVYLFARAETDLSFKPRLRSWWPHLILPAALALYYFLALLEILPWHIYSGQLVVYGAIYIGAAISVRMKCTREADFFLLNGSLVLASTILVAIGIKVALGHPPAMRFADTICLLGGFAMFGLLGFYRSVGATDAKPVAKYRKSKVSGDKAEEVARRLHETMDRKELYKDQSLSLESLAAALDVNRHTLSQVLNDRFGKSFQSYVQELRIREAKRLLLTKGDLLSIEGIGREAGFASRSVFYAAFRKEVGMAPSEFRKASGPVGSDILGSAV